VLTLKPSRPDEHRGHRVVMGLDWGQANDYTAPALFCETCMREVWIERMRRQRWETMRERVAALYRSWSVARCVAESNSIGGPNIEELEKLGLKVEAFETTSLTKAQVVQSLKVCFEKGEARWLDDPAGRGEAQAYESRVSPTTGRVSYSAPEGMHDDTVIARCLAWYGVLHPEPKPRPISQLSTLEADLTEALYR
jgi:hypothetical protein